ncbi:anti-sigma factor family protein [Streptomyces sp. NPDC127068]|uniref:anti-sigma factor family protein n=1 Tax=Streptomyces sp. NPDC127068 TaxID=3347127 RepID=UPI003649AEFA
MTTSIDTAGHPAVEEISDLTEGLLPPDQAASLRLHLDACPECTELHASLEEIRSLLEAADTPGPMPDDVAARVDAALVAEAAPATRAESPDPIAAVSEPPQHVSRETAPPAKVPDRTQLQRPAGHGRGGTGPGRTDRGRSRRIRTAAFGTVLAVAALGLGSLLVQSMDGGNNDQGSPTNRTAPTPEVHGSFSKSNLQGRVHELLKKESPAANSAGTDAPSLGAASGEEPPSPHTPFRDGDTGTLTTVDVPECVQQGIGRTEQALASEEGTYGNKAALLVVMPHVSDTNQVSAYVVDTTCVTQRSAAPGKVLLAHSYPRR